MGTNRVLVLVDLFFYSKSLEIPKGQSESVCRRRTDNTLAKRKSNLALQYLDLERT
jgi:hypothetical protein